MHYAISHLILTTTHEVGSIIFTLYVRYLNYRELKHLYLTEYDWQKYEISENETVWMNI